MVWGVSSSSGTDRIPTKVVNFILPVIVSALIRIVNLSFENSVFPRALKHVRVINRFKGGSRNGPESYIPISALSVLSKIFKKRCFLDFLIFLIPNIFFVIFSLVLGRSIQLSMRMQLSWIVYIQLLTLGWCLLLFLSLYDIIVRGNAYSLFLSYLSGRFVSIDSHFSNPFEMEFGFHKDLSLGQ